jgi:hypothetical protein
VINPSRAHDHDIVGRRREHRKLAIQDCAAVNDERAFVAPAEACRLAAGQDRCATWVMAHGYGLMASAVAALGHQPSAIILPR